MRKESRFKMIYNEGSSLSNKGQRQILVDKETGVNYLVYSSGYAAGITPLLDANGKPVVTKVL